MGSWARGYASPGLTVKDFSLVLGFRIFCIFRVFVLEYSVNSVFSIFRIFHILEYSLYSTIPFHHSIIPSVCHSQNRGCLPFTRIFREIRFESKWNTTFWVFRTENFREQRNIWKGSPVFPDEIFQTEIRVPFPQSHLWYQFEAFAAVFR